MLRPRAHARLACAAAASHLLALWFGAEWERRLVVAPSDGMALYAQASGDEEEGGGRTFQRIRKTADSCFAEFGFQNFNRDLLTVQLTMARKAFEAYDAQFGYSKADLDEIEAWHEKARQGAYQYALKSGKGQAAIDAALSNLKLERDKRIKEYMASKGFRVRPGNVVEVDMPGLVRKNTAALKPVAMAFEKIATGRRYDSESLIGGATSLVQTALRYQIPPTSEGSKRTGGLLPPLKAFLSGWGDCDSKTGLLASILANWPHMRMVGVAVPGHYLMGILRIPGKGEIFVEHQGLQYVLIEPAGPAWLPPGHLGQESLAKLQASQGYRIEPFF